MVHGAILAIDTMLGLHVSSTSPFFVPFKNGLNAVMWRCLHLTLKRSKEPLTKMVTLTVSVNKPLNFQRWRGTCEQGFFKRQMNAIGDSTRYVVFNSTLLKQLLMLSNLGCITQKKLTLPKKVCMFLCATVIIFARQYLLMAFIYFAFTISSVFNYK